MDILTEADLRSGLYAGKSEIVLKYGTFITPLAKEFLHSNSIKVVYNNNNSSGGSFGKGVMSYTPIPENDKNKYIDYETHEGYSVKPENMTHLYKNVLVPKNNPRILFRGKLDSLEAMIMHTQIVAVEEGYKNIANDLDDVMNFVQHILASEVKNVDVPDIKLLGMNSERLRYASHHLKEEFGIEHSVPHYTMGKLCVELNSLRTFVREAELYAVSAFSVGKKCERNDIVEALNRLSSCVYIIFCKKVAGQYD